jgi:hypothetical protein
VRFAGIVPINNGTNISSNASWCAQMTALRTSHGLTLGMHGVHHQQQHDYKREFEDLPLAEARERVELGLAVWLDAFGERPTHFSFPGVRVLPCTRDCVAHTLGRRVAARPILTPSPRNLTFAPVPSTLAIIAPSQEWGTTEIVRMLKDEYGFTVRTLLDGFIATLAACALRSPPCVATWQVRTLLDGLFHRIYHCDDSFCGDAAALCRTWALNIF